MNHEIDEHYPCFGCYCKRDPVVNCTIENVKLQYECPCGTCLVKVNCDDNLCDMLQTFIDKNFPKETSDIVDRKKIFKRLMTFVIKTEKEIIDEIK